MKKVILVIAVAVIGTFASHAQKQVGGDKNLELTFTPLGNSPVDMNGIRFRMFNSDGTGAIRLSLWLGGDNTQDVTAQAGQITTDSPILYMTDKSTWFGLAPGYEKHFEGTDRLSPYVGAQVMFSTYGYRTEEENYSPNSFSDPSKNVVWTETWKGGNTMFGLGVLAGVDFYFADNIYLGAEFSLGMSNTKIKDSTYEVSDNDAFRIANGLPQNANIDDFFKPQVNGKMSMWGNTAQTSIRLGWLLN